MIIEKIVVIFVALVLMFFLAKRFIKRYAPENLVIIPLLACSTGIYIRFAISNIYIPIYLQLIILLFLVIVPFCTVLLQYNNIIISRKLLYYKMKCEYVAKNYRQTIKIIEKIVSIEGRRAEHLYILGNCYKNLNDFINARDSFSLAVELNQEDYKSYYELGCILDETNKKDTAMIMFDKALKIKPDFYEAEEALGICLTSQGRFEEAVEVYKKALKYHEDSYELYYNIAIIDMELRDYEKAEEAFENAVRINSKLYTAFYNIGNLDYLKGDYEKAIEAYKNMLESVTFGPRAYYKIAITYSAMKEYDKAMSSLEYAMYADKEYINKSREEYLFNPIRDRIEEYIEDKDILEEKKKQRRNYMKETLRIFKKSNNENKREENIEIKKNIKQA